jgi:hypothetical protein
LLVVQIYDAVVAPVAANVATYDTPMMDTGLKGIFAEVEISYAGSGDAIAQPLHFELKLEPCFLALLHRGRTRQEIHY